MSRIRVATLGRLRIERDGREIRDLPAQPVRCALFLHLALERAATRDELAALLWPERDGERARRSLNQTLYELRQQLGDDWVASHRDRVEVTPAVAVDALDFVAAAEAARDEEAFAAYGGSFLEGYHLGGTAAFEAWADRRRSHLGRLYRDVCRRLVDARVGAGDPEGALAVARRWAEMDPLEDEAHHHIVGLLAETGRRSEALLHYDAYRELIARELEVEPLEETRALVARIREGVAEPALPDPEPPPPAPAPSAGRRASEPPPPPPAAGRWTRGGLVGSTLAALLAGLVLAWHGAGGGSSGSVAGGGALDPHGIAVLPFVNMSAEPEQEYFSDGITEDLLASLSRTGSLRVISRTSVMRYKQTELPIREIARELGVRYVLEGSVRREDDQVRITAQLIDAASDSHLWAETYDRELSGIFAIQSEIAQRIAAALEQRLSPTGRERFAAGGTANLAAYDLLLRGREYLNRPGDADLRKFPPALNFFRLALEIDPGYARAYVGLSEAFRRHAGLNEAMRLDSALVYARQAVEADPELAEAAAALGAAYSAAGQPAQAEREFRRALALDRNEADAMSGLAWLAILAGRFDEAVRWQRLAVRVDPTSADRLTSLGRYLFDLGDLAGAEAAFQRAIEFAPDSPEPSFLLAQIHLIQGEPELADQRMNALVAAAADHPATQLLMGRYLAQRGRYQDAEHRLERSPPLGAAKVFAAYVAKKLGQRDRMEELLRGPEQALLEREREGLPMPPRPRVYLPALRGDREAAISAIEEQWRTGLRNSTPGPPEIGIYWIDAEPFLEDLRGDPRFQGLLRRMRAELDSMRLLLRE